MNGDDRRDLPLFHGPHIRQIRFEGALERLDFRTAVEDAPSEWKAALEELAIVLERAGSPVRASVEDLVRCRREAWPVALERAWQRLIGLNLDGRGIPGTYAGELAAAFLLRAGETELARRSLQRHLQHYPRDPRGGSCSPFSNLFERRRAADSMAAHYSMPLASSSIWSARTICSRSSAGC